LRPPLAQATLSFEYAAPHETVSTLLVVPRGATSMRSPVPQPTGGAGALASPTVNPLHARVRSPAGRAGVRRAALRPDHRGRGGGGGGRRGGWGAPPQSR